MELPVAKLFKRQFGHKPPHVVQAPGRLELLGNHTDYNAGLVMALAVDKYVYVAATPRTDGKVKLVAGGLSRRGGIFRQRSEKESGRALG